MPTTDKHSRANGAVSPKSSNRPLGLMRAGSASEEGSATAQYVREDGTDGSLLPPAMNGTNGDASGAVGVSGAKSSTARSRSPALPSSSLLPSSSSTAGPQPPSYQPPSPKSTSSKFLSSSSTSTSTIPPRLPISRNPSSSANLSSSSISTSPTTLLLNPYSSSNPDPNNPYLPSSSHSSPTSSTTPSSTYFPSPISPPGSREQHPFSAPNGVSPSPAAGAGAGGGGGLMLGGKPFFDSEAYWLGLYFFFNLGLTLFNKIVLVSFPFPYTLTGLHALSGCIGCYFALERGSFTPAHLTSRDNLILAAFSVLYTINIAVSNLSLQLVTVPFHQVVRAATPLFTIMISVLVLRASFSRMKILSLLPVVAGVGFATYGDYYFTAWGLILTLIGTALAALKTVTTNLIQTGAGGRLKLHPLDLLMRMSPLAFIQCVLYGWYTGELERVRGFGAREMDGRKATALLINGVIAFGLNVVSFTANKKTSALTMTVSANVKQVLTIVLAVIIFDLTISPINCLGIILTLAGGAGYAYIEYKEGRKKAARKGSQ